MRPEPLPAGVDRETGEIVPYQAPAPPTLFGSDNPRDVVSRATATADALAEVVKAKGLASAIQGREHVRVEGWTLLGTMLGVFPICVWTRKLENGWEARVEARTLAGQVVGAAEAQCTRDEPQWSFEPKDRNGKPLKARDDFALRSMAQTRATSKALRQPLGFVMALAGFEATPAEEMGDGHDNAAQSFQGGNGAPVDDERRKKMERKVYALMSKLDKADVGMDKETVKRQYAEWYGTEKVTELSDAQLSELIDRLVAAEERLT